MRALRLLAFAALAAVTTLAGAAPDDFSQAKRLLRQHVYFDQNRGPEGTFYCGCKWEWVGKSGGRVDLASCGYESSKMRDRAARTEIEHVMPVSLASHHFACWRNGGRENCQKTDPAFNRMEADMHNLTVAIGSVNGMRSALGYGMVTGKTEPLGACTTKIGTEVRSVEPRDEVKGQAARVTFYMADRYNIRLAESQQKILIAWDKMYPVSEWERERDRRIARAMGHHNPFVTGEKRWTVGFKPSGEGLANSHQVAAQTPRSVSLPASQSAVPSGALVQGNKRSGVYHLPFGCPSYGQMSEANKVEFASEAEAIAAGFRKAGNCS